VEYVHALVVDLAERYEDGESASERRRELLDEHKWRALRYGHEAELLDRDLETTRPLGELLQAEADRLDVPGLLDVFNDESGAARQRRLRGDDGLDALCESLVLDET
jgi:carboxylate-amine ligase